MSYFGAVKAHSGIQSFKFDSTGQAYHDPGNKFYKYILRKVWPGCLPGMSNAANMGDVMEAFLGFGWFMEHSDNIQAQSCRGRLQVYENLHKVMAYVFVHWGTMQDAHW